MRILVIHQYYLGKDDAGGSRFNQFAKHWTAKGHRVTVIAGTVHYATGKRDERYKGKWIVEGKESDKIKVLRTYVSARYNKSFVGRLWAYISFTISSTWAGLFRSGKQDLVLATSPPLLVGITGYLISKIKRIPFIFEVRDLWPESAIDMGVLNNRLAIKLAYWLESFIYKSADKINVLTPAFKETLLRKGVASNKIVMIPNGADLDIFRPGAKENRVREKYGWDNRFVVMYIGAHGLANHLIQLVEVARESREHENILFVLVGDGMEKPKLAARAKEYGLKNIQFIDSQPKSQIANFVNASDVCTAVLKKADTFKTVYPNKVFDYMSCAKPVIIAIDGAARRLIEDARAGIYVEPENIEEFKKAVLKLYNNLNLCTEYGQNGYEYVKKHFSRESLADQYEVVLQGMVGDATALKATD
jgi:glycosyltransferase involved in cell wall biosynthesis